MGIRMNGGYPTDPQIHDESFYHQILSEGTIGLGEAFMEGKWSCQDLEGFLEILAKRKVDRIDLSFKNILFFIVYRLKNLQTKLKSKKVIEIHYEDNNEMYEADDDLPLEEVGGERRWRDPRCSQHPTDDKRSLSDQRGTPGSSTVLEKTPPEYGASADPESTQTVPWCENHAANDRAHLHGGGDQAREALDCRPRRGSGR